MILDTPWNIPFLLDIDPKTDPKTSSNTDSNTSDFRHNIERSVSISKSFSSIKGEIYEVDDLMLSWSVIPNFIVENLFFVSKRVKLIWWKRKFICLRMWIFGRFGGGS